MGMDGFGNEVFSTGGRMPALCQQLWIMVASTSFHGFELVYVINL